MRTRIILFTCILGMSACTQPTMVVQPDGKNRVVDIVNDTEQTITNFVGVQSGAARGIPIGNVALEPQGYISLDFDIGSGACLFDFSVTFTDETTQQNNKFDVCEQTVWTVTP